jgi:hypothetical protein
VEESRRRSSGSAIGAAERTEPRADARAGGGRAITRGAVTGDNGCERPAPRDRLTRSTPAAARRIYTIGHSNHPLARFLALLREHAVELVADARSQPYSRRVPHFGRERLAPSLQDAGLRYEFLGAALGGRPPQPECYDAEGHVLYARLADSRGFRAAIERLEAEAARLRVAVLCSEEDPGHCHRKLLIARVLAARGVEVLHLRGDGRIEAEPAPDAGAATAAQLPLFADGSGEAWRSTRSLRGRGAPRGVTRSS